MKTLIFKISPFDDVKEPCWREVELPEGKPLSKLAEGIINAFEFDFDHAYGFFSELEHDYFKSAIKYELFADMDDDMNIDSAPSLSVEKTKTSEAFIELGQKMQFIFDYGEEWRFLVELIGFGEKVSRKRYPSTVNAVGEAPIQYPDWEDEEGDDYEDEDSVGGNPRTAEIIRFPKH